QYSLGALYSEGHRVTQSYAEAFKWFRQAAEQGHSGAQYSLGIMYRDGRGIQRDNVQAYLWFHLAALGLKPGKERDLAMRARNIASTQLSPAQRDRAQQFARNWQPVQKLSENPKKPYFYRDPSGQ